MLLSWGRRSQSLPSTSNHMRCSLHGTCTVCSVAPSTASFLRGGVLLLGCKSCSEAVCLCTLHVLVDAAIQQRVVMCRSFLFEPTMLCNFQETLLQTQWLNRPLLVSRADDELPAQYDGL